MVMIALIIPRAEGSNSAASTVAALTSSTSLTSSPISITPSASSDSGTTTAVLAVTTTDPAASNTTPFFPDPSTSSQPDDDDGSGNSTDSIAKSVLEWLFLSLVLLIIAFIIFKRLVTVRRSRQPASRFFSLPHSRNSSSPQRAIPRTTGFPPSTSFSSHHLTAYDLANVPTAYTPSDSSSAYPNPYRYLYLNPIRHPNARRTRTRAADIGEGGRRTGGGPSDYDGEVDDKDVLPAYDKHGGPPGYVEMAVPGGGQAMFAMGTIGTRGHDRVGGDELPPVQVQAEEERREDGGSVPQQQQRSETLEDVSNPHAEATHTRTPVGAEEQRSESMSHRLSSG